jgi:hypothetical protein
LKVIILKGGFIMKKFTIFLITIICLSSSIPAFAATLLKEGVYKPAYFNYSSNTIYNVQNVSPNTSVYFAVFDENQVVLQALKLEPQSTIFNIPPLKPNYRIAVIGNGEVTISEKTS